MLMRVSLGIHKTDLTSAIATYHLLSERWCAFLESYPAFSPCSRIRWC